jgi:hypothetical protein
LLEGCQVTVTRGITISLNRRLAQGTRRARGSAGEPERFGRAGAPDRGKHYPSAVYRHDLLGGVIHEYRHAA